MKNVTAKDSCTHSMLKLPYKFPYLKTPFLQCKVYLVEDVLMNFLLSILEGGGAVEAHPLIQQLLDLMWLLMEVSCLGAYIS